MNNRRGNQRQQNDQAERQDAHAPYNFVSLPERPVDVREQPDVGTLDDALPSHNVFRAERRHGYFDVTLTTESPLYIRGMLTRDEQKFLERKGTTDEEKVEQRRLKNKPDFFSVNGAPVIPGSSLRGMIRALVEIITWSKLTRVTKRQLFYRTVDDSVLGKEYSSRMTGNVEAGFLQQNGSIFPTTLLRVNRSKLGDPRELYDGSGPNMTPRWTGKWHQYMPVWVRTDDTQSKFVDEIRPSDPNQQGWKRGILVITGNIPRKKSEFVFLLPSVDAEQIEVPEKMLERFHDDDQITQWQEKAFPADRPRNGSRERKGMLVKHPNNYGNPIFFLRENDELVFFGRAGMFRLPYRNSPTSLIPDTLRSPNVIDFAEAMFGFINPEKRSSGKQGDKERAYAGRLSVTDARMITEIGNPFEPEITPPILSTPKPTAFQHYLEQPNTSDPKKFLHYDSGTKIRGHKLYWRQRRNSVHEIPRPPANASESQLTRIRPIKREIQFTFRVEFENLTDIELGALAWVLALGSEDHHPDARHMLGMGKPFGLGVVKLDAQLMLRDRQQRYTSLFDTGWSSGDTAESPLGYIQAFEDFMPLNAKFGENARIVELLALLTIRSNRELNDQMFSNMTLDEFKKRSILRPARVIGKEYNDEFNKKVREARDAEAAQQRAEIQEQGIPVNYELRGKVDLIEKDGTWLLAIDPKYADERYEAKIPPHEGRKNRDIGATVKARVIGHEGSDPITLICEMIVDDRHNKKK